VILSQSTENYLKAIFELESETGRALTGDLAATLSVSPASVSGMLRRLTQAGHVRHVPYRGVSLSTAGRQAALRVVRRHRVLETYLSAKLGYGWDSVHAEAERLEHVVSDEMVERMAMALGNPSHDPHGAPIPGPEGEGPRLELTSLADVPPGEIAQVRLVSDNNPDLLRYLASLGLRLGARCEVAARQPFRGPITLRLLGPPAREHVIGHELASEVLCEVVPREAG
jgi:DtxR family Mn-dependent transcriptional regulator